MLESKYQVEYFKWRYPQPVNKDDVDAEFDHAKTQLESKTQLEYIKTQLEYIKTQLESTSQLHSNLPFILHEEYLKMEESINKKGK